VCNSFISPKISRICPFNRLLFRILQLSTERLLNQSHSRTRVWFLTYNSCKLTRLPMEEGISPVNWFAPKDLEINQKINHWALIMIVLPSTYNICKLTRWPMEDGISPANWFPLKYLEIKSESKLLIIFDYSSTYKCCKLTRLPMEEGISPVNWLAFKYLEMKSENKSVILSHKILMIVLQLTMIVNGQDCQWKRVYLLSIDFCTNILK
jgi:hypothetical protein